MNWLLDVCTEIRGTGLPSVQTEALMARATELAGLCERFVPKAPRPTLERDDDDLDLAWVWAARHRKLTLIAHPDGQISLALHDEQDGAVRFQVQLLRSHEQLRIGVTSFFDGWGPR